MRIQTAIFVDHDNAGQFRRRLGSCVGADRPDEISFDASVPLRRRDGLVGGLDPVIGLGYLLPQSVVRHQRFDNRCRRQTADRKSLHAVHEVTAADLAVNKKVIEFYGLARQFGFGWLHWLTPFQRIYHFVRHEVVPGPATGSIAVRGVVEPGGEAGPPRADGAGAGAWPQPVAMSVPECRARALGP